MIENNPLDLPFIRTFQFDKSPLEVIEEALTWAENFIRKKSSQRVDMYPSCSKL